MNNTVRHVSVTSSALVHRSHRAAAVSLSHLVCLERRNTWPWTRLCFLDSWRWKRYTTFFNTHQSVWTVQHKTKIKRTVELYKRQRVADWSTQARCWVSHTGSWRLWRTAGPATCPPRAAGHTATEPCSRTGSPGRCAWTRLLANMAHVAPLAISDTYVHNSIQVISTLYEMRNTNQYQCCSLANFSWSNNAVAEHTQYYDCGPKGKSVQHTAVLKCSDCTAKQTWVLFRSLGERGAVSHSTLYGAYWIPV